MLILSVLSAVSVAPDLVGHHLLDSLLDALPYFAIDYAASRRVNYVGFEAFCAG